jgi:hypothetical protein
MSLQSNNLVLESQCGRMVARWLMVWRVSCLNLGAERENVYSISIFLRFAKLEDR